MPTIAIVDGIRVVIFPNDHDPPHFHAILAEHRIRIEILSNRVMGPNGPASMERKVLSWSGMRRAALMEAWTAIREGRTARRID